MGRRSHYEFVRATCGHHTIKPRRRCHGVVPRNSPFSRNVPTSWLLVFLPIDPLYKTRRLVSSQSIPVKLFFSSRESKKSRRGSRIIQQYFGERGGQSFYIHTDNIMLLFPSTFSTVPVAVVCSVHLRGVAVHAAHILHTRI